MIDIDGTLFVQIVIFLCFTAYLHFSLLRPLGRYLARRQETIDRQRTSGAGQDTELNSLRQDYSKKIAAAREDHLSQRSEARREALDLQQSILAEAKKEAAREVDTAQGELLRDAAAARRSLEDEARALAAAITEKILGRAYQS